MFQKRWCKVTEMLIKFKTGSNDDPPVHAIINGEDFGESY